MKDIAVIGLSFQLPQGCEDEDTFWSVLERRKNLMTEWPEDRITSSFVWNTGQLSQNTVCDLHVNLMVR